jgi:hypothetical protein
MPSSIFARATRPALLLAASCLLTAGLHAASNILWDNGPLLTHAAGMSNGADRSSISVGGTIFGAGAQTSSNNRVADDFTVSGAIWTMESARFFTYQTGSTTTSTLTGITLRVWDDVPGVGSVVWGDDTTNVLSATGFTGMYRTSESDNAGTTRPIMFVDVDLSGLALSAGTYWLDFSFTGSLASGPWAPPVSSTTEFVLGNALQSLAGGGFNPLMDGSSNVALPFVLSGTAAVPEPASSAAVLGAGVVLFAALRRRRSVLPTSRIN